MDKVLVCRTAWMDFYRGLRGHNDKPRNGGSFVRENGFGHEIFNFLPTEDGRYRGYVRAPGGGGVAGQTINIDRLGASSDDDAVDGVTVFWAATNDQRSGTFVVGWYDNATVYRRWRASPRKRRLPNGNDAGFMIEAVHGRLISFDERLHEVPSARKVEGGIGQAQIWYPKPEYARELLRYKAAFERQESRPRPTARRGRRMLDTERRLEIERRAMAAVIDWCDDRELPYQDVSLKRVGWDIEAGDGTGLLRIEVKGTSAPIKDAILELTPNEFTMMKKYPDSFRVAVVSVQGTATELAMFKWSGELDGWFDAGMGFSLTVKEVLSARLHVSPA